MAKERRSSANADSRRWQKTPPLQHTGKMLREARERRGLGLRAVSIAAGVSVPQLSDMERGISTTPLHRVPMLCQVLGVEEVELVAAVLQDRLEDAGIQLIVRCDRRSS